MSMLLARGRVRARAALLFVGMMLAFPDPAGAEGVLRQPPLLSDGSAPLYRPQHPCAPGQKATDPDCGQAKRSNCLAGCQHEFQYNGDMMYLRWCERGCEEKGEHRWTFNGHNNRGYVNGDCVKKGFG